jgi:predicted nucleic acid-binding protein
MSVVLDSCAVIALGLEDRESSGVEKIISDETCYMSPASVAEVYFIVRKYANPARANLLLEWMMTGKEIRVTSDCDADLIEIAGKIMELGVSSGSSFSAALACKMGIPVVTNDADFDAISKAGFCKLRKI